MLIDRRNIVPIVLSKGKKWQAIGATFCKINGWLLYFLVSAKDLQSIVKIIKKSMGKRIGKVSINVLEKYRKSIGKLSGRSLPTML